LSAINISQVSRSLNPVAYRRGGWRGELPQAEFPKGVAFGWIKKEKREEKLIKKNKKDKKKKTMIAYRPN